MEILFEKNQILDLTEGIVYYNNTRILQLPTGTYDVEYMVKLLDQCKYISRMLPINLNYIGFKKINDNYELIATT